MISCLSTPVKLYGVEPWVFTRVGRPALLLCGSLWGKESDRGQCHCWLTFGDLPGTHPFSSHFTHFPYVTGAPPAVVLVVDPKVRGFAYILGSPEKPAVSSTDQLPLDLQPEFMRLYFSWCWNPGLCSLAWGWDCSLPRYPS